MQIVSHQTPLIGENSSLILNRCWTSSKVQWEHSFWKRYTHSMFDKILMRRSFFFGACLEYLRLLHVRWNFYEIETTCLNLSDSALHQLLKLNSSRKQFLKQSLKHPNSRISFLQQEWYLIWYSLEGGLWLICHYILVVLFFFWFFIVQAFEESINRI